MISIIERVVKFKELIIALTSLAASVTAIIKIYDDTQAKKQYDILRESVIELSKNSERNHEDIASIHNYLAGVVSLMIRVLRCLNKQFMYQFLLKKL